MRFNCTFFRGTKEQLLGEAYEAPTDKVFKVTVKQDNKPDIVLDCPGNIRQYIVGSDPNAHSRWDQPAQATGR